MKFYYNLETYICDNLTKQYHSTIIMSHHLITFPVFLGENLNSSLGHLSHPKVSGYRPQPKAI